MGVPTQVKCKNEKCKKFGEELYIWKNSVMDDFVIPNCEECGELTQRIWKISDTDVCGGLLGNSKDGYQSGVTYHPSKFGKMKTTKVR